MLILGKHPAAISVGDHAVSPVVLHRVRTTQCVLSTDYIAIRVIAGDLKLTCGILDECWPIEFVIVERRLVGFGSQSKALY